MNAELRKLKTFQELSRETNAFSAELWISLTGEDKQLAAYVENDGGGGSHMIRWVDRSHGKSAYETAFNAWTKAMPPTPADDDFGPLEMDAELWIGEEMDRIAWEQQLKRRCSRNTLIRLEGDSADESRTFTPAVKFTPEMGVQLRAKHGAKLIEIINERFVK